MENEEYIGVVEDPRDEESKSKDYKYEDLAQGEITLNWVEYNEKNLKSFPIQDQDGSSSCVAQATSKILAMHEVLEGKDYTQLCPKFIYTRRNNYPDGGMWFQNALEIACKSGSCPESFMPCANKGESFMNEKTELNICAEKASLYKGKFYFNIPISIKDIAEVMEQGYGVLLGFRFDYDEWTNVPYIKDTSKQKCHHGVAGVDYCLYNGKRAIIIEDSWGPNQGKGGRRIITEDFLLTRCSFAGYVTSLPNYVFTKTLRVGSKGLEVKMIQEKLGITADGIFGVKTKRAVIEFQKIHQLVSDGIVGIITMAELNK